MLFELLKTDFATATLLYVGYSNSDPNWQMVLDEITSEFYPSAIPSSYRVAPSTSAIDKRILKAKGTETIDSTFAEFVQAASLALAASSMDASHITKAAGAVPTDLAAAFGSSPAAVARLLNSWTYVHEASFSEAANLQSFLRGDRANWGLIANMQFFERDLEDEVYEDILDYATSASTRPSVEVLIGPAGYGTTTLLMVLAARIVKDKAGSVFMLRPGATVLEGDVEFASSILPGRPFFVVDNATDHGERLHSAISRLREMGRPALFLLGERLNEWRQGRGRLAGKELELEPLSDPEIDRLLDYLGKNAALKDLEPLSRDFQRAAVKEKHGKELLVTMREATEGELFDAILEDEFRGIKSDTAQRAYLYVCCFYQHGAYVRDSLLASLIGVPLTELYEQTSKATEGVIAYDCIDEANGRYGARARHRTIATIVWGRCGDSSEKERIVLRALGALNLNYRPDAEAFDHFVRSESIVDAIKTLEGRIKFFDTACHKDPESPYVRQHYARMLLRSQKSELALGQIEEALRLNPKVRVLYHTKGQVLAELALSIPSHELGRKRLMQSEEAYRRGIVINDRDEYSYTGLAQLYLGWAKRAADPDEEAIYVAKAEETISEGLRKAQVKDGLWIVSSEVEKWVGDEPSRLKALEKAMKESPGSMIARYLLGRAYRREGRAADALKVLEPVVKGHPEEYRAVTEYALSLLDQGEPFSKATAVLKLSTLYGYEDPKFIATLGGTLFMRSEFTEAQQVFNESLKRGFSSSELNAIRFRPRRGSVDSPVVQLKGRVVAVKAGYCIIENTEFPPFLCPGSKYNGLEMRPGMQVLFEPAFAARGAQASHPVQS
jgi:tetratricopeptide (TPR) repeat protein